MIEYGPNDVVIATTRLSLDGYGEHHNKRRANMEMNNGEMD